MGIHSWALNYIDWLASDVGVVCRWIHLMTASKWYPSCMLAHAFPLGCLGGSQTSHFPSPPLLACLWSRVRASVTGLKRLMCQVTWPQFWCGRCSIPPHCSKQYRIKSWFETLDLCYFGVVAVLDIVDNKWCMNALYKYKLGLVNPVVPWESFIYEPCSGALCWIQVQGLLTIISRIMESLWLSFLQDVDANGRYKYKIRKLHNYPSFFWLFKKNCFSATPFRCLCLSLQVCWGSCARQPGLRVRVATRYRQGHWSLRAGMQTWQAQCWRHTFHCV